MKLMKDYRYRLVPLAMVIAATGMALSGCASRDEADLYERIAFPERRTSQQAPAAKPAPAPFADRMGGGEGGGGGGGGGGH